MVFAYPGVRVRRIVPSWHGSTCDSLMQTQGELVTGTGYPYPVLTRVPGYSGMVSAGTRVRVPGYMHTKHDIVPSEREHDHFDSTIIRVPGGVRGLYAYAYGSL